VPVKKAQSNISCKKNELAFKNLSSPSTQVEEMAELCYSWSAFAGMMTTRMAMQWMHGNG